MSKTLNEKIVVLSDIASPHIDVPHGLLLRRRQPSTTLDANLLNQPLTLILQDCHVEKASQSGHPLTVYEQDGRQMVDFNPHGGPIVFLP